MSLAILCAACFTLAGIAFPGGVIGLYSRDPEVIRLGADYLRVAAISYLPTAASFSISLSMRSVEKVRLPLAGTVVSLGLNAFLNWVLIFGKFGFPSMGVVGAAWATVISRVVELAVLWIGSYAMRYPTAGKLRELFSWNKLWVSRFLTITLPVIANEVTWSLGITTYNAVFGRAGTMHIAAYNVANTVSQLAMVLFLGTANAAAVMIGKKIGEGQKDVAEVWARRFAFIAPLVGLAVGLLLIPVRAILPWLFKLDTDTLYQVSAMLVVLAFAFPFKVFNLHLIVGICRSGGDTKFGFWYDLGGIWGIGVPLAVLGAFVFKLPAWGIFLLTMTEELAKSGFGLWRLLSRKWIHSVMAAGD
ncbi:MAG TPA: MATE family efflux transporter, partial [Spirochaetales bacterium]|nr:MATE family efflux transporter [Spirochaetales bacterium]